MTLRVFLYVSGTDGFLLFFCLFSCSHSHLPLLHCVSPPPGTLDRFLGPGIVCGGGGWLGGVGGWGGAPELSASALMCPSFRLQSIPLSIGGKRGGRKKTQQNKRFGSHYVSLGALSSARVRLRPRRAAPMAPTSCQDTSMISMLPEKLDCFPILPSSSRDRLSEMPSSNSI